MHCSHALFSVSQLSSLSPWSSKEGSVQTSSPSSVDTVMIVQPHCGYTMGQWRVAKSLAVPSLVQCTLFKLEQNTQQPLLELTMYKIWMDMSSSVCMMTWAPSSRAMQSSTPSFLLVSVCAVQNGPHGVSTWPTAGVGTANAPLMEPALTPH